MLTAKVIDAIFRAYIKQAQGFEFVAEGEPVDFSKIVTCGDSAILTKTFVVGQVWFSQRLINAIEQGGKITVDEAIKRGIADVPGQLENRLICWELKKEFDLSECPQFTNGLLQIEKRKDFLMPVKENGLIKGLRFECFPSKRKSISASANQGVSYR